MTIDEQTFFWQNIYKNSSNNRENSTTDSLFYNTVTQASSHKHREVEKGHNYVSCSKVKSTPLNREIMTLHQKD